MILGGMLAHSDLGPSQPYVGFVMPPEESYGARGGAIATVTRGISRELIDLGCRVDILAPGLGSYYNAGTVRIQRLAPIMRTVSIKLLGPFPGTSSWDWPGYSAYLLGLRASIAGRSCPPVMVVHNDIHLPGVLRRWLPDLTIVLWLHNEIETRHIDPSRAFAAADYIVAVSESVRRWTIERYDLDPSRVSVNHNGVDLRSFHPRTEAVAGHGTVRVICHGRLDPNKGFDLVAEAVRDLRSDGLDISMSLAGGKQAWGISSEDADEYWRRLFRLVDEGGGEYLGRVAPDDLPLILREHDVACAVSRVRDPFPLAPLEAMASGCATIVSDRGGLPELAGDACVVVKPERAAVRDALATLALDGDRRSRVQHDCRRRAEMLSWEFTARRLLDLLSTAAHRR